MTHRNTGGIHAYRVEVAEIGAAIGSGDVELLETMICNDDLWVDHVAGHVDRDSVSACLTELLEGGALAEEPQGDYAHAFQMLCATLGVKLPLTHNDAQQMSFDDDPFDIPFDDTARIRVSSDGTSATIVVFDAPAPDALVGAGASTLTTSSS